MKEQEKQLSELDRLRIEVTMLKHQRAEEAYKKSRATFDAVLAEMRGKYELGESDQLDVDTGKITRGETK